jgi:hypothetical protein
MKFMKNIIKRSINNFGFDMVRYSPASELINKPAKTEEFPSDFNPEEINIIRDACRYTMTSTERLYTLIQAVKYISTNNIDGDIVECGVWKGGSMMAIAKTFIDLGDESRNLYLFDTFSGMTEPSDKDIDFRGINASTLLQESEKEDEKSVWCYASLELVKEVMSKTGYDNRKIHFIKGKVEETIPSHAPDCISLLRLDTDWYESTRHELIHLFPRLSKNGVLIIDDYGHWKGSKLATDEYFSQNNIKIFLNRIDNTGRVAVKL